MPLGVDEAGKGPALGSMFAAAVYCPDPAVLPEGIADSKQLSAARREELAQMIRTDDRLAVGVAEITTARIDDPDTDMNSLAVTAHAEAITTAVANLENRPESISGLCDACDTDADRFGQRVGEACAETIEANLEVDARHGADDDSPVVGAASIIAKVERDAHVARLAETYGDVGSGYPSDPTTRAFLEAYVDEHGQLPGCARESWSTCADVLAAAEQTGLGQF